MAIQLKAAGLFKYILLFSEHQVWKNETFGKTAFAYSPRLYLIKIYLTYWTRECTTVSSLYVSFASVKSIWIGRVTLKKSWYSQQKVSILQFIVNNLLLLIHHQLWTHDHYAQSLCEIYFHPRKHLSVQNKQ